MSQFQEKVFAACAKKEALFDESLGRYALRSMLAGAYLTMSTAVGIIGADVIATGIPALSRFVFAFIFAIGLVFVLIFNGELATSNMMFLTSGCYRNRYSSPFSFCLCLYLCHRTGLRSHIQWRVGYFKHDVPDQWCLLW